MRRIKALGVCLLLLTMLLSTCPASADDGGKGQPEYTRLDEISGKNIGVITGFDEVLRDEKLSQKNTFTYYPTATDTVMALKAGRVDVVCLDEPVAQLAVNTNEGIAILPEEINRVDYGIIFPKGSDLTRRFNQVIAQFWENGTMDSLQAKWMGSDERAKVLIEQDWPGAGGVIRYYHDATYSPMCYIGAGGRSAGYDLDLVLMIARELDLRVELTVCDFDALVSAVQSGKADVASGCMNITEEKRKNVDFSDPYYKGATVFLVRTVGEVRAEKDFFTGLRESFYNTFVVENRWKMILDGLGITILISICSGVCGLLMGFGLCMLRRMRNRPARLGASGFIKLIQGMPIVVFLMLLYYVIFGAIKISGVVVSIIAFSINFSAYTSEMMRTGIETVDRGQSEAALAMGYSKAQTFWKIVFPQAARHFLPVMRGEFISMVKMTSVVGYVAVVDLTKASDLIRSRTMEAFFPLIATAIIYFAVANLLTSALSLAERRINPKRKKRVVRGVAMQ